MSAVRHPPALVISLDLEQAWGSDPRRIGRAEIEAYHGARLAIPRMLDLAARHDVAMTWATVGLLFFAEREEMIAHLPDIRPVFADPHLSAYARLDKVGRNEVDDPLHFGRSLLLRIRDCPRQEIAGHSFSHYYAMEDGDDRAAFAADLSAANRAAALLGVRLRSLVFPRNQVKTAYLPVCRSAGYSSFRGAQKGTPYSSRARSAEGLHHRVARLADSYLPVGRPTSANHPVITDNIVDIAASHFLRPVRPRLPMLNRLQWGRIRSQMLRAAREGGVCHIWWHPQNFGRDIDRNLAMLQAILEDYRQMADRFGMVSMTMAELADQCLTDRRRAGGMAA